MIGLSLSMTLAELLALPPVERVAVMRALQERLAALGDDRPPPSVENTQQGDGSVGVMTMPSAYTGTVLASTRDEDD